MEKLKKKGEFAFFLSELESPVFSIQTDSFPSKGKENAKITLVEFADYQCPHCKEASNVVKRILDQYKDKMKFVFIDFPINHSGISTKVSEGAYCANVQNKFWDYHYAAFSKQEELNNDSPLELAKSLGLDIAKFTACYNSQGTRDKISGAKKIGEKVGIRGTPSFFLNGKKILNFNEETLLAKIKEILKS